MDINDFIIDTVELKEAEKKKTRTKKAPVQETFSLDAVSGCDVVISKHGKSTETLALIISQDLFYIKKGETTESLTLDSLKKFFSKIKVEDSIEFEDCGCLPPIQKSMLPNLWNCINDPVFKGMAQKGITTYKEVLERNSSNNNGYDYESKKALFEVSYSFYKWVVNNVQPSDWYKLSGNKSAILKAIYEKSPDYAKYFLIKLSKTSLTGAYIFDPNSFMQLINDWHLDFKTFIDYIMFGLYKQGFSTFTNTELNLLTDYYRLTRDNGKKIDKYPKDLAMAHNLAKRDSMQLREIRNMSVSDFRDAVELGAEYNFKNKDYIIRAPRSVDELIDEGNQLGHCVGTYGPKIANRECMIYFMRTSDEPDKSLLTVELRNYSIYEIEGDNRRSELTQDEKKFLQKWADKFSLSTETNENFYDSWAA